MLTSGTKIGGFLIGDLLGKGAMGEVYKGEQLSLKRPVAIKRIATHLLENEDMVRRFKREAQVLAKVTHPNVVGVIECEEFPGPDGTKHLLLIMELIEGGRSLKSHLGKPIDWRLATTVVHMAADGLAAAFEQHVVHRDIKPDNIMMTHKGIAKLVDFGLAKAAESTALTMQAAPMGTPLFMSPESCRGEEAGHASDLYSLGVSWFFMLTGRYPFEAANLHGLLYKHISEPPPPPTGLFDHVPAPIVQLVYQCLEKDPAKRPASAVKLVEAIESLPAQGLLLPRDARELVGSGHDAPHLGSGSTTAGTLVAGNATAATLIQGGAPGNAATVVSDLSPRGAVAATMAGDLSPHGAVAQTVVSNLSGNPQPNGPNARPVGASTVPTSLPGQPAPVAAPVKSGGGSGAIIAVVVVLVLGGLGFAGWKMFGGKPESVTPPVVASNPVKPPGPVVTAQVAGGGTTTPVPTADPTRLTAPKGTEAPIQTGTPQTTTPAPANQPPVAVAAPVPKPEPPKPIDQPKPEPPKPVEQPKPVEPPKPVDLPKPVEQPKPEPVKPVELPKLPPPDSKAFDAALAAKRWADAKAASDALPEPLRGETAAKLAKAAGQQLRGAMTEAKALSDQELYRDAYARLNAEASVAGYADPKVKDAFVRYAATIRDAAKAQENP